MTYVEDLHKKKLCDEDNLSLIHDENLPNFSPDCDRSESMVSIVQIDPNLSIQKRILIVDDQTFNIQALKIILQHSVGIPNAESITDQSLNGKEAVDMVERNIEANNGTRCAYDMILMDCNMPVMDGYEASI